MGEKFKGNKPIFLYQVCFLYSGLQLIFVLVHQIVGPLEDIGHGVILVGIEFRHAGGDNDAGSGVDMGEGSAAKDQTFLCALESEVSGLPEKVHDEIDDVPDDGDFAFLIFLKLHKFLIREGDGINCIYSHPQTGRGGSSVPDAW